MMWCKLFSAPDLFRQRATLALSELFVVSHLGLPISWRNFAIANYWETLEANAFGNFRNLLEAVTLSSAMGTYLNMKGNQKYDAKTGRSPDENYAREVLQLFTIGLYQLNIDGTLKLDATGKPIETYDNNDIQGLARVFTGWNTAANGSGTDYAAGGSYTANAPLTLYAKWTGNTYNVTYDGNGSTGGAAPSAGTFTSGGTAYTVPSNGTLTKTGYTFAKWNTAANGSGTDFGPGTANTTYSTAADQLLYAQWTTGTYTISFDGNGSTGGSTPSAGSFTTGGAPYSVPGNTGALVKSGFSFSGWNTLANGTGTDYAAGASTISPTPRFSHTAATAASGFSTPVPVSQWIRITWVMLSTALSRASSAAAETGSSSAKAITLTRRPIICVSLAARLQ
jgi:uncharacterized repeat protein (TIGR02543 family)